MPYGQLHNGGDPFSIDMNALWAMAYCCRSFSIYMNALWAIAEISHREIMSIERIRCMYCFVRRTLTTKSERKYFNNAHNFLHPTRRACISIEQFVIDSHFPADPQIFNFADFILYAGVDCMAGGFLPLYLCVEDVEQCAQTEFVVVAGAG